MKNINFVFLLFLSIVIMGCDPIQSKLDYCNKSKENVFYKSFFISNDSSSIEVKTSLIKVERNDTRKTESIVDIRSVFDRYNDSLLNVVIFKDYTFLNEDSKNKTEKSDSLLKVGDYKIKRFSYTELKKNDWLVTYPDDGFEQGKPLILDNKTKQLIPSPEILKEKGIEDRWSKKDSL